MFLLVYITRLFSREVHFISKGHVGVLCSYTINSRHSIAEIQLMLALKTNQSINLQIPEKNFSVEGDFGEWQFCANRFIFLSFNAMQSIPM
jgi:hypothetical protein